MSTDSSCQCDIAIIGLSVACPGATTVGEFWRNLAGGADSITDAPPGVIDPFYFETTNRTRPDRFPVRRGGFLSRGIVDPIRYGILPVAAEASDPDQVLSLMLSEVALLDAGVLQQGTSLKNASIVIGKGNFAGLPQLRGSEIVRGADEFINVIRSAVPGVTEAELSHVKDEYQKVFGRWGGDTVTSTMPNLVASAVSNHFDMRGPAYTLDAACASGIVALEHTINLLATGQCDLGIVGAMHTGQSAVFWSAFHMMGAMSPTQQIAPFSEKADGLLIGQGAGFMIVKTLERALADGDRIYAVVRGTATGSDGGGHSVLVTNVDGQAAVLERAWARSGLDPADVAYVEAHGTGTPVGDAVEIETLTRVFGDAATRPAYLGSVKSNIGHLMPAAGMMGLLKTTLALYHRQIPPTLHCAKPDKAISASRFTPVQELVDWEAAGLPLLAGVDAFGFGGINAHAVLTAYEEPAAKTPRYRADRRRHLMADVFAISAPTREALLKKVDPDVFVNQLGGLLSGPDDRCRIVIFDPSEERLHLAAQIVRRGEPWFGLNDIWYTEKPLVADGGKIAFVFPGWEFMDGIEHDSLLDEFGLSWHEPTDDETYPGSGLILDHYFTSMLAHDALVKSGIRPDVYAGHSIGEWHAARAAGMVDEEFDKAMVALPLDPANQLDPDIIPDFRLVAASGGLDEEAIAAIEAEVPDAYLTTDNCPSQKVFCVLAGSLDRLTATLKARHVGCTVLPYASPLHTPFVAPVLDAPLQALSTVPTHAGEAPVWSSVLVAKLDPANATAAELLGPQLTRPIRFRALLEEMYAQGVRVFVQCGAGSLTGFVDDTLHGRDFAALPAVTSLRPAVDQLRRLHALMFILGGPADLEFMGMGPLVRNLKSLYLMPSGFPVLTEVPAFTELLAPRLKDPATVAAEPPAPTPAPPGKTPSAPPDAPAPPPRPPMAWQTDALGLPVRGFSRSRPVPSGPWPWPAMGGMPGAAWPGTLPAGAVPAPQPVPPPPAPAPPPPAPVTDPPVPPRDAPPEPATVPPVHANPFQDPVTEAIWRAHPEETVAAPAVSPSARRRKRRGGSRAGTSFTEPLDLDLDRFPEVMDHCIVNQPVDWPYREDVCPVVPLTLSMELMAELAMRHAPGQKVVKLGPITAMNFMPVNEPFHATVKGFWKSNDVLSLSVAGHLMMDVTFANEYPDPPVEYVTRLKAGIGAKRREPVDREEQYLEYTFHRPRYWSLDHTILMGEHGFHSEVRKAEGKGSLLDAIGQAVGLYLHLYEDHDTVSFPVRVNEVSFYQDMFDQDGAFDSYCHIREVTDNFVIGDAVYERDGKIWVVARGWANQRIPMDQVMWESVIHPWRAMLSREIAPHVYAFDYENPSRSSITFLALRYLTADEKRQGGSMPSLSAQGDYLAGRIALKDAARAYLRGSGPGYVYPIEVASAYEESGKLLVRPHDGDAFPVPLHVSLAHRDNRGVAVASGAPVGIDLERIEHRDQGFWDLAFTSTEQELIRAQATPDEAATRVWVAKEAVGKQRGTGLHGAPTRIVATRIEDGAILLDGVWVDTMKLDDGYIVGRTREELLT